MGIRQGITSLGMLASMSLAWTSTAHAQAKPASPPAGAGTAAGAGGGCPPPVAAEESPSRLRALPQAPAPTIKKFKIKLDKGGNSIGVPATAADPSPAANECFFVLAENQTDVVAEITFQKAQKNKKGVGVWVFVPARRSEAGKKTLNLNIVAASQVTPANSGSDSGDLLPAENALILPSFLFIQNAAHQAANVRSGVALNIPVSGFGAVVETFVPRLKVGTFTNMIGVRTVITSWSAAKFSFKRPVSNEVQDAAATGSGMQIDLVFRYPFSFRVLPRLGFFVSPVSKQTEILKISAGASSPENTQTVIRSGLLAGAELEVQPAENFFLGGRMTMSFSEKVEVSDVSGSGENLSGTGTATRLHLTGSAGVRIPLISSKRLVFEGLVGNTMRSDKYSDTIAYSGQQQQKDIVTFFQAGFGYIL